MYVLALLLGHLSKLGPGVLVIAGQLESFSFNINLDI